jgi:transcriptional regulator with XRE-family HTH domain
MSLRKPRADETDAAVGARVRARRIELNLSQAALARAAGVSYQQIQKYERGADRLMVPVLLRIAARLGCSVGALLGEEDGDGDHPLARCLAVPGAVELVERFARIGDDHARRSLLDFLREVARIGGDGKMKTSARRGRAPK